MLGEAKGEGHNENDQALNESVEEVETEYAPTSPDNYRSGERVKLNVCFNRPHFSSDNVHSFIMRTPFSGWKIEFLEHFTIVSLLCDNESIYREAYMHCFMNANNCTKFYVSKV